MTTVIFQSVCSLRFVQQRIGREHANGYILQGGPMTIWRLYHADENCITRSIPRRSWLQLGPRARDITRSSTLPRLRPGLWTRSKCAARQCSSVRQMSLNRAMRCSMRAQRPCGSRWRRSPGSRSPKEVGQPYLPCTEGMGRQLTRLVQRNGQDTYRALQSPPIPAPPT
jgi:hypothetical protein